MECEDVRKQFADHLGGDEASSPDPEMTGHLEGCSICRNEMEELQHLWTRMNTVSIEPPDSGAMRSRFNTMLDLAGVPGRSSLWSPGPGIWRLRPAFQLGFALVLVGIGIVIGQQLRPAGAPEPIPEVSELRTELRETRDVLQLMQQQSATDRLRGVNRSNQISQPGSPVFMALLETLEEDPSVNVRVAAVNALEKFGRQEMVRLGLLEALKQQESPVVQAALIDTVVALRETQSVEILRRLAKDSTVHESVRKQAQWALEQLT